MSSKNCGNCNFHGETNPKKIYCYFWLEWRVKRENDYCDKFQEFAEQNKELRQRLATEKRKADEELKKNSNRAINDNIFSNVILEKEQQELLFTIVEASRNLPRDKRQVFYVIHEDSGNSYLQHPGLQKSEFKFHYVDLELLSKEGFVHVLKYNKYGIVRFDVHPRGLHYYKYLKEKSGEPVEKIEETVHRFIDTSDFQKKYPKAYEKWAEAENLLWDTESPNQLTTIGHLCREAIQEFMDTLYLQVNPPGESIPKDKTLNRLREIIEANSQQLGKKERAFLQSLHEYWKAINGLIQKQEHGSKKENAQLVWKDGRRVVFQTLMLMYEVSQSLK